MDNLRPQTLDEIIGNENIKQVVKISINAAQKLNKPFPSTLFYGCSGCGKTTFATVIANTLGVKFIDAHGGNLTSLKSIMPYFGRLINGDRVVFFIDEVHRMAKVAQELLFPAMEDYKVDPGKGRPTLKLKPFTLIAATTEGTLLKPLVNRFKQVHTLYLYNTNDLSLIISKSAQKLRVNLTDNAISNLAQRSRGTPRLANNYLNWIRDCAISQGKSLVTEAQLNKYMDLIEVQSDGTTKEDQLYLNTLRGQGRPTALSSLTGLLNLSRETIEENIEPYLLHLGKIQKTSKGRILV